MNPFLSSYFASRLLRGFLSTLLVVLLLHTVALPLPTMRYVSTTGTGTPASATSWVTSTTNLQGTIDYVATNGGDKVWVAAGVYKPGGNASTDPTVSFSIKNGVSIPGGFTGTPELTNRNPASFTTIISGEIGDPNSTADDSYQVISNPQGLTTIAMLDGVLITAGPGNLTTTQLATGSPAIDMRDVSRYTAAGGPPMDLAGNPRFVGPNYIMAMGAYEELNASPVSLLIWQQPVTVSMSVTGTAPISQWYKDGTALTGVVSATTANLILSSVGVGDVGTSPVVTGAFNSVTSTAFSLTLNTPPTRLYVKASATGANTGQSWEDAFTDLQSALAYPYSQSLTEIWVAAGVYKPASGSSFAMVPNVAIYGGFTGVSSETSLNDRPAVNPVTGTPSSATLAGNGSRVITNPEGLTTTAILDGFVITDGANVDRGGGMYNKNSSPAIRNCWFVGNQATGAVSAQSMALGGAMFNEFSSPILTNCSLQSNTVIALGQVTNVARGGAIYNNVSSPQLTNCSLQNNQAIAIASGQVTNTAYGGAINSDNQSNLTLTTCSLHNNQVIASGGVSNFPNGGAIFNNSSQISLINCSIQSNTATFGGALYNYTNGIARLTNCSLQYNWATNQGGAFFNANSLSLINCSLQGNQAVNQGGAIYNFNVSSLSLANCVFWNNGGSKSFSASNSILRPSYSLFEPSSVTVAGVDISSPGNLTTSSSPFASTTSVALALCSPAINTGNPASVTAATGPYSATALPTTDLAGNPRIVGGKVDMGAVEYQSQSGVPLVIVQQPVAGSAVCVGSSVVVSVGVTGSASSYQWYKSGTALTGIASATTASLSLTNVLVGDMGSYSVIISNDCSSLTSEVFNLTVNASSTRLYVKANATGANTGLSWDDAFTDLQQALTYPCFQSLTGASAAEIWVAAGVYKPTSSTARDISFSMKNGVGIYGGFVGSETALSGRPAIDPVNGSPSSSTLSGEIGDPNSTTDNSYHVITNSGLGSTAVLDGFVISGGNANGTNYNGGNFRDFHGGAIYNYNSNPVLSHCSLQSNQATNEGGAIYNYMSSPVLSHCSLQNNQAASGGAIYNYSNINSLLTHCSLQNNQAASGGAIYNYNCNFLLTHCSLQHNQATNEGGAIYNDEYSSLLLTYCSLQNNQAASGGVIYNYRYNNFQLTNSVLWNNGGDQTFVNNGGSVWASYCLLDNINDVDISRPGNLTTTTLPFTSTTSVALNACSPAINAGNPASVTAANGPYSEIALPTTDLVGNPRIVGGRVDMGAVEFQTTPSYPVAITLSPAGGIAVCLGGSLSVPIGMSGTGPFNYQWYQGASPIISQTDAIFSLPSATTADAGSYSVVVAGACNSFTTTAFSLTVNDLPSVTLTASRNAGPPSTTLSCTNPSLTLTAQTSATAFVWSSGGSTSQTLPVSQSGVYSVTVTDGNGCSVGSNSLSISQDATAPSVSVSALSTTLTCANPSLTLTATSSATALRWSTNETTASLVVSATGLYSVTATAPNGCTVGSNSLSVSQDLSLPFTVNSVSVCQGQTTSLLASGCSGQVRWSTGATGSSLTVTAGSSTSVLSATCMVGSCSTTGSGSVVIGQLLPPLAQILGLSAVENPCPVRLLGQGVGTSFVFTGPGRADASGYVFSVVYREPGTYSVVGLDVRQPGVYTLTAIYTNACGSSLPVSQTVTVSRSCP